MFWFSNLTFDRNINNNSKKFDGFDQNFNGFDSLKRKILSKFFSQYTKIHKKILNIA